MQYFIHSIWVIRNGGKEILVAFLISGHDLHGKRFSKNGSDLDSGFLFFPFLLTNLMKKVKFLAHLGDISKIYTNYSNITWLVLSSPIIWKKYISSIFLL